MDSKNTNKYEDLGMTPHMYAAYNSHSNVAAFLVQKGADINAKDDDQSTALMYAAFSGSKATVELLIEKGADVNSKDNLGFTALDYSTMKSGGNTEIRDLIASHMNN